MAASLKEKSLESLRNEANKIWGRVNRNEPISKGRRTRHARLIAEIIRRTCWRRRKLIFGKRTYSQLRVCEFCLSGPTVVAFVKKAIASETGGDWICANCDPRVEQHLQLPMMEVLIGVESS